MKSENKWSGIGVILSKKNVTIPDPRGEYHVTDIALLCSRTVRDKVKKTVVPLEAWGTVSDLCKELIEGDWVQVEGRFENKNWNDKEGRPQQKNVIVVEAISKAE